MSESNKWRQMGESLRAKGIAMTIPMVMVAGPVAGALIGRYLANRLELPWIMPVALLIGLAASIMESVNLLRQLSVGKEKVVRGSDDKK